VDKDGLFSQGSQQALRQIKPAFDQADIVAMKKRITMPAVDMNKFKGTSYITYYQLVREKIRRIAYQKYSGSEVGYTYMTFIVSNDGLLKEVRLVKERSSESVYLQQIALRSIKDASPFPSFPGSLDYPQLSFNVIISFEVE
jgi:outer membrane biosynthesis protein TonB